MRINLSGGRAQKVQKSTELHAFKVLEKKPEIFPLKKKFLVFALRCHNENFTNLKRLSKGSCHF